MQARPELSPTRINDDLLRFTLHPPRWFWVAFVVLGGTVTLGVIGVGLMIAFGLQLLGYTHVQQWAVLITHFIFWVGISHAGVMVSAILRLTEAEWRRPITRAAEVLAIFALITAALFPVLHTGRPWRAIYWLFPYDFTRDIWPSVRSALVWDVTAILSYLTGTILFVYIDLIPDLATIRDRSTGWRRRVYGALALNFRGTTRQWKLQRTAGILLSALILPVFVSVHSTVAWDFAMAILPGWHSTVFAPYFVIGAVHSGVAAVVSVMALLRWLLKLPSYITEQHFDTVGRLQIVVVLGYLFFFLLDIFYGLYGREAVELRVWELRLLVPPVSYLFYLQVLTTVIIPLPLWLFRRFRRNVALMFWLGIVVNIGMWLERYILVTTPLSYKHPFVFTWVEVYHPQPIEWVLSLSFLALVLLGFLVFARIFPIIPLWDVKEGQVVRQRVRIGRARVPGAIRE